MDRQAFFISMSVLGGLITSIFVALAANLIRRHFPVSVENKTASVRFWKRKEFYYILLCYFVAAAGIFGMFYRQVAALAASVIVFTNLLISKKLLGTEIYLKLVIGTCACFLTLLLSGIKSLFASYNNAIPSRLYDWYIVLLVFHIFLVLAFWIIMDAEKGPKRVFKFIPSGLDNYNIHERQLATAIRFSILSGFGMFLNTTMTMNSYVTELGLMVVTLVGGLFSLTAQIMAFRRGNPIIIIPISLVTSALLESFFRITIIIPTTVILVLTVL